MPNYVSHLVKVSGQSASVEQFKTAIRKKDSNIQDDSGIIDFNRFIKMPEALLDTTSPSATRRVEEAKERDPKFDLSNGVHLGDIKGAKLAQLLEHEAELRDKYGYDNWYDWSIANWGTKWNAVDPTFVSEDESNGITTFIFHFKTAWTMPEGIINSMVQMCKALKVQVEIQSEEEGSFFDCLTTIKPNYYEVNIGEPFYYLEDEDGNIIKITNDIEDEELKALGLNPDEITGNQRGFVCDNTGDLFIDFKRTKAKVYAAGEKA